MTLLQWARNHVMQNPSSSPSAVNWNGKRPNSDSDDSSSSSGPPCKRFQTSLNLAQPPCKRSQTSLDLAQPPCKRFQTSLDLSKTHGQTSLNFAPNSSACHQVCPFLFWTVNTKFNRYSFQMAEISILISLEKESLVYYNVECEGLHPIHRLL